MMRKAIVCSAIQLITAMAAVSQTGIQFETKETWSEIQSRAKANNKYIFLDIHATWCGPCKEMDANVFTAKEVGDFFNEKFISVKVQTDTTQKDNEYVQRWYADARDINNRCAVSVLPTLVFIAPSGQIVRQVSGLLDKEKLVMEAKMAMDTSNNYAAMIKRYHEGKKDPEFIRDLARAANMSGNKVKARQFAQSYINGLNEKELFTSDNLIFIFEFTRSVSDRGFRVIMDNEEKIAGTVAHLDRQLIAQFITSIIYKDEAEPFLRTDNNNPDWSKIKNNLLKYGKRGEEILKQITPQQQTNNQSKL